MKKLTVPLHLAFGSYKGFVIRVNPLDDDSLDEFVGVAINEEKTAKFMATGKTRNGAGQELERYIDEYRKFERRKLIVN